METRLLQQLAWDLTMCLLYRYAMFVTIQDVYRCRCVQRHSAGTPGCGMLTMVLYSLYVDSNTS